MSKNHTQKIQRNRINQKNERNKNGGINKTAKNKRNASYTNKFIDVLMKKYPNCVFDKSDHKEEYKTHKIIYGEMNYDGIHTLQQFVFRHYLPKSSFQKCTFIDIGMGRGKLPLYMSSNPRIVKSVGVELVKERFDDAVSLKNEMANAKIKGVNEFIDKIEFIQGDVLKENLTEITESTQCFIWMSNLCFDQKITDSIFNKLYDEINRDSIICCSKNPQQNGRFIIKQQLSISMSWNDKSDVFIVAMK